MIDRYHIIAEKGNEDISKDELWHGALYGIVTMESGTERVRLLKSDPVGNEDPVESVKRICEIYPDVKCYVDRSK